MADPTDHAAQKAHNDLVLSFLAVRRAVGILGFFLPCALFAYALLTGEGLRLSISGYYYSPMREVFVGTLLAQAVFLWSYEGYREPGRLITDKLMARIAAISVALVALSPTHPVEAASKTAAPSAQVAPPGSGSVLDCLLTHGPTSGHPGVDYNLMQCLLGPQLGPRLHAIAAVVFFVALAIYCLVLFVRGPAKTPTEATEHRLYRFCGWTILVCVGLIALLLLTKVDAAIQGLRPIFWLETVACFAFATSWAVKGQSLRPVVRMLHRSAGPRDDENAAPPGDGQ